MKALAAGLPDHGGVYMMPAFVGLGAPHWVPDARVNLTATTFGTRLAHLAQAAQERRPSRPQTCSRHG